MTSLPILAQQPHVKDDHLILERQAYERTLFGFWLYVMTDCVLFATLFATYAVLHLNTFGGPSAKELFSLPSALTETLLLLVSSFSCGLTLLAAHQQKKKLVLVGLSLTILLGAAFLFLELTEFHQLILEGNTWRRSAFLSAFFTLVGAHGLHITCGLFWALVMLFHVSRKGLSLPTLRRLTCFGLFWHFLDVIWIFIFAFVYLMGAQ